MRKHSFTTVMVSMAALGALSFLLTGCSPSGSQAPKGGYPGGQQPGARSNDTTDPHYTMRQQGRSGAPTSGGAPGSGGH